MNLEETIELAAKIANSVAKTLPTGANCREDLKQVAIEAALVQERRHTYDPTKGASEKTYVGNRMRGAILDYLRQGGSESDIHIPRTQYKTEHRKLNIFSLDSIYLPGRDQSNPITWGDVISKELVANEDRLHEAWEIQDILDFAEKATLFTWQESCVLTFKLLGDTEKSIGEVVGVTESRVSQIYRATVIKLAKYFGGDMVVSLHRQYLGLDPAHIRARKKLIPRHNRLCAQYQATKRKLAKDC